MIIHISETKECWICGEEDKKITSHHALPKHLKPKNNIIVPICEDCHKKINACDVNGMYSYLYKIKKSIKENVNSVNVALNNLEELNSQKTSEKKSTKYQCGHRQEAIILDDNELSLAAYYDWIGSCGYKGDESMCWECYCSHKTSEAKNG